MDSHESNSAGGIIAVNPSITPLRWKLDTEPEMPSHGQIAKNASGAFARNLKSLLKGNSLNADPDEFENLWNRPEEAKRKLRLMKACFDASVFTMDPAPPRLGPF